VLLHANTGARAPAAMRANQRPQFGLGVDTASSSV